MTRNKTSHFSLVGLFLLLVMQFLAAKSVLAQSLNKSASPDTIYDCTWSNATALPTPVIASAGVSLGGFIYIFGGVRGNTISAESYKFNGTAWTPIAPLPVAVELAAAVTDGTNIFIMGGINSNFATLATLYRYNPIANTYTQLASFNIATWGHAAVYLNGKIYKFCGTGPSTSGSSIDTLEIYNVANNTWTAGAVYPIAISLLSAWTQGGFIYGAGGHETTGQVPTAKTYRYDTVGNIWNDAAIADLPATRWGAATALYTDAVLAGGYVGGNDIPNISNTVISWNQVSNTWQTDPDMLAPRAQATGAVLNGNFYVLGGRCTECGGSQGTNDNQKLFCLNAPGSFISSGGSSLVSAGPNGVLDPSETVTVSLGARNVGGPGMVCTTTGLTGTLQASGGVTAPSAPQNYGTLCSGSPPAFRDFTFTIDAGLPCGRTVTVSLVMTDGATNYGTLTYAFTTGNFGASYAENFDGVAAPALPPGWTTTFSGSGLAVGTSTASPDTAPNDAFLTEHDSAGLSEVASPTIAIAPGEPSRLIFRNLFNTEPTFDGLVLEISINGGAFQDILDAGGTFVTGGYNSSIGADATNPLQGRLAWTGLSSQFNFEPAYITTIVNLPAAASGHNIQLKWRQGSDSFVAPDFNPGSRIDTISIVKPVCSGSTPAVSSTASRKMHGAAGTFDVPLPLLALGGAIGVEDRVGTAGVHQMVVAFTNPVTVGGVSVTTGTGSISSFNTSGAVVTINLVGVTNAQRLGLTLASVSDGINLGSLMVPMGILAGDTSGNRAVSSSDVSQAKLQSGQAVTGSNFRNDINVNGSINATDVSGVKLRSGTALP